MNPLKLIRTSVLVVMAIHIIAFTIVGILTGNWRMLILFVICAAVIEVVIILIKHRKQTNYKPLTNKHL